MSDSPCCGALLAVSGVLLVAIHGLGLGGGVGAGGH